MTNRQSKWSDIIKNKFFWLIPIVLVIAYVMGYVSHPSTEEASPVAASHDHSDSETIWTCSMHPQIRMKEKGLCPICGMELIPATDGGEETGPWELHLSEHAQKLASLEESEVQRRYVAHVLRVVGKIEPNETLIGNITARFPGRIDRLYVDFSGTTVRKGDHLVSIYSPEMLSAQKELLEAIRSLKTSPDSLKKAAQSRVKASREKLRLWNLTPGQIEAIEKRGKTTDHVTIYAPMKGIVLDKHAVEGDYVKTGTPIYTINDLSKVWLKLDIYESDLKWVRLGQEVEFEAEAYPGEVFKGKIVFIDPILNPKTRTVRVRINVPNEDLRLKPDMFVRAKIFAKLGQSGNLFEPELIGKWMCPMHPEIVKDGPGTCDICGMDLESTESLGYVNKSNVLEDAPLIIPASAVLQTGTRAVVYVAVPGKPGNYEGREIVLGPRAGDYFSVVSGLEEGERVVTNGAFKIDSELQIQAKNSMMYAPDHAKTETETGKFAPNPEFSSATDAWFGSFLTISESLSQDNLEKTQTASRDMLMKVEKVSDGMLTPKALFFWQAYQTKIKTALDAMRQAADLETARLQYSQLSDLVYKVIERYQVEPQGFVVRFHCPMAFDGKGAFWLQETDQPRNPYFGSQMMTCFDTKDILSGSEQAPNPSNETTSKPATPLLPKPYLAAVQSVFRGYFALQDALTKDQGVESVKALDDLSGKLKGLDMSLLTHQTHKAWMDWSMKWEAALKAHPPADDLKGLRVQFETLTNLIKEFRNHFGMTWSDTVYQFHCPMAFDNKGADWFQDQKDLKNPYFGPAMLKCGSLTETIEGDNHEQ